MIKNKILAKAFVGATLLAFMAGCAPQAAPSSSKSSDKAGSEANDICASGPVTLKVWSWRTEDVASYNKIFDVFEKKHDCVTVNFEAFKNTEYNQILQTGLSDSSGPDVAQLRAYGLLQPLVDGGSLQAIDDVVDDLDKFGDVLNGAKGKKDGKVYGVPFATQTLQVYYNKKIFKDNKIDVPKTWDDFIDVNEKLKKAGVTPLAVGAKDIWTLPILHDTLGSAYYGGKDFESDILSGEKTFEDPKYVESIQLVNSLKKYMPDDVVGVPYTDAQVMFTTEQAAMFPGGTFELKFFETTNPELEIGAFQIAPKTGGELKTPVTPAWADGSWGISSKTANKKAAEEMVKWMATKEYGQLVADELQQFSPVPGVEYDNPVMKDIWNAYSESSSPYLLLVDFRYGTPSGTDLMGAGIQKMLLGEQKAEDVAKNLQTGVSQWFKAAE